MAAASQLWYVPYRPDLILLAPCDATEPLPPPGSVYVSVDHLHPTSTRAAAPTSEAVAADTTPTPTPPTPPASDATKWRHPRATAFVTCFGDISKQQPRVVRCACGASPCKMRGLVERGAVPDELIPTDWDIKWELPPADAEALRALEGRRAAAVQLWLDCTARAEKELPRQAGQEVPPEKAVLAAAEVMLTDYLKGRVCFKCSQPSTKMQKCGKCLQARYCCRDCQRDNWPEHKKVCGGGAAAAAEAHTAADKAGKAAEVAVERVEHEIEKVADKVAVVSEKASHGTEAAIMDLGATFDQSKVGHATEQAWGKVGAKIDHLNEVLGEKMEKAADKVGHATEEACMKVGAAFDHSKVGQATEEAWSKLGAQFGKINDAIAEKVEKVTGEAAKGGEPAKGSLDRVTKVFSSGGN